MTWNVIAARVFTVVNLGLIGCSVVAAWPLRCAYAEPNSETISQSKATNTQAASDAPSSPSVPQNASPEPVRAQIQTPIQTLGQAEDTADIIAYVNGAPITQTEYELAESELGAELAGLPGKERQNVVFEYLVETMLMANAARKAQLEQDAKYKKRLEYYRRRALRDMFFERKVRDAVTEDQARAIYNRQIGNRSPKDEVRVRHILVETKKTAETLITELNQGRNFGTMAQKHSLGPSKVQGGDLGYFSRGQMVKAFEEVAFKLKVGAVSAPVKTQFGWHVLLVEDKRISNVPSFETVKDRIRAPLIQQKAQKIIRSLKHEAKIKIVAPDLRAAVDNSAH